MKTGLLHLAICVFAVSECLCAQGDPVSNNDPASQGDPIPLADPSILYHDGVWYAYGTSSDDGFEAWYTRDAGLREWKKHPGFILSENDSWADRWFWAPEVYYIAAEEKFYLYYSADEHICVATATSPLGPFSQTVRKPMRSEKSIDSSLFIDDDGTPYLFFVRFTGGNVIWGAELEKDFITIKEDTLTQCIAASLPWETVQAKVAEGPSVLRRGDLYYMIYSANHYRSPNYGVGYATAASPLGPWTKPDAGPILQNPRDDLAGTGHGAPFVGSDGRLRYVFHAHGTPGMIHPRKIHIAAMTISDDGVVIDPDDIVSPVYKK